MFSKSISPVWSHLSRTTPNVEVMKFTNVGRFFRGHPYLKSDVSCPCKGSRKKIDEYNVFSLYYNYCHALAQEPLLRHDEIYNFDWSLVHSCT